MLKPALLYKEELLHKFSEILYTEDYYFFCRDLSGNVPEIDFEDGNFNFVFVDKEDNLLGFFTYQVFDIADTAHNFGIISFDKGNPIIGIDLFKKLKELLNRHHKIEWRVIDGNSVKEQYDKFCKKHGGYIHHIHDVGKDLNGNYVDSFIYEIINPNK